MKIMLNLEGVKLPRSIIVAGGVDPWLIIFADASAVAMGCVAYVRWKVSTWDSSEAVSRLIMA